MKLSLIAAVAGALALSLAACGKKTEEPAATEPAALEETGAAAESATTEQPAAEPMGEEASSEARQAAACVIDVAAETVCTADTNACGHSSLCDCPAGYGYDAALGKCLLDIGGAGVATPVSLADTDCAKAAAGICTKDINVCGQPSSCSCEEGFAWNAVAGKCLRTLN